MEWDILSKFLETLLLALINLFVPLLAYAAYSKAKEWLANAKAANPSLFETYQRVAEAVVYAAEQSGAAGLITDKKAYAMEMGEQWLLKLKLKIDLHLLSAAIEQKVLEVIKSNQLELPMPAPVGGIPFVEPGATGA